MLNVSSTIARPRSTSTPHSTQFHSASSAHANISSIVYSSAVLRVLQTSLGRLVLHLYTHLQHPYIHQQHQDIGPSDLSTAGCGKRHTTSQLKIFIFWCAGSWPQHLSCHSAPTEQAVGGAKHELAQWTTTLISSPVACPLVFRYTERGDWSKLRLSPCCHHQQKVSIGNFAGS